MICALRELCPSDDVVGKCFHALRVIRFSLKLCSSNFKRYLSCYIFKWFIFGKRDCFFGYSTSYIVKCYGDDV